MQRILLLLLLALAPLGAYVLWVLRVVQREMGQGFSLGGIVMLLAGLGVLAVVEGLIFKFFLLPRMAGALSERFYAGSYFPEDDPLALLSRKISAENRPELLPELARLVESDPHRARAWLELARLHVDLRRDIPEASRCLLQGAAAMRNREDAAMLTWRAAVLLEKSAEHAAQAPPLYQKLAEQYPATAYGKLAAQRRSRARA